MPRPQRQVPVHYLRPNHASWTPPALLSFDTETRSAMEGDREVMTMRLWSARFTDRRPPKRAEPIDTEASGTTASGIAKTINDWCRKRRTVWGYAHNLGFDLCTSELADGLMALGWHVTEFAVSSGAPFVRFKRGDSVLTLSDSWSWFQQPLEKVAEAMGMSKTRLPKDTDTQADWLKRCQTDVAILHAAMQALMEYWDTEDLGRWNLTGSASGWNAMRHIPTPERILIRPEDEECDHDRKAIYGGRRQCWRTGGYEYGHYTEIDIEKAYTTAARDMPLPMGRQATFTGLPLDHRWLNCRRWGVIAECVICTDEAVVPVKLGNGVWYPVGRFKTTLAGPDIKEARDLGILESVGPGWLHRLGYALRPWAQWCIDSQVDGAPGVPPIAQLVHRVWGRSAVGKWAQRGFEVIELGPSMHAGWNYEEGWHHEKNVPVSIVDFGGTRYQVAAVNQSDNAYPAVLAFIESYVRVALGRAIRATGDSHMVACDTDGYIATATGAGNLAAANQQCAPFHLRPKRHFRRVKVIGPQHLELDQTARRSGIPASATRQPDGKLEAWTWPKLGWQMANGRQGAYVRPRQVYTLAATYAPGWSLSDGAVVPVELTIGGDGCNAVVPFPLTRYGRSGRALADHQHRQLERYRHVEDQARSRAH